MTPRIERPIPRRGLSRVEAAMYLGISPSKFDELRRSGRIGPAKILDGRKLYAVEMLDEFFDGLPDENHERPPVMGKLHTSKRLDFKIERTKSQ